ncbi:hypothetical protein JTE90_021888 [Oedothorax gibbosus]|uniref:Uncharacterized protein n=1 Tax=Oedothorax gibbosus TaxID=931172 RepID=A0AAV6V0K9_9ARAC|nr:hypothetical protein JTE90_021888 [Oedothorax gibbosus]
MINLTVNLSDWPDDFAEDLIPFWKKLMAESIIPLATIFFAVLFLCYLCYEMYANEGGIHYVAIERAPLTMRKVLNPFSFDVNAQSADSSDVLCTLSTTKTCLVLPFWGVPLSDLFEVLRLHDWISIKHAFSEDNTSFKNKCLASSPSIRLNSGQQEVLSFRPPPSLYEDVDPRLFLPLVIVMVVEEHEDTVENIEWPIVCVQIVIVHVPLLLENTRTGSMRNPSVVGIYVKEAHSSTIGSIKVFLGEKGYSLFCSFQRIHFQIVLDFVVDFYTIN